MTADAQDRLAKCTCARDGHARRCPIHTQEDFEAADRARAMTAEPSTQDRLAAVLAEHRLAGLNGYCGCGWATDPSVGVLLLDQHRAHVAAALATVVAEARAEERERIAQAIEAAKDAAPTSTLFGGAQYTYGSHVYDEAARIARADREQP